MTPKDKAIELVDRFYWVFGDGCLNDYAKQCALICVDEIIAAIPTQPSSSAMERYDAIMFWINTNTEIENL